MVNFTILAGGYATYVASYSFNTEDNSLTYLNQYTTGADSQWIISHPTNKTILYVTSKSTPGELGVLSSFTVGPEGAMTLVDTIYSGGSGGTGPSYCAGLSTGQVAVTNYYSGTARVVPTERDYLHFSDDSTIVTFPVPTTGTQGMSEPHMTYQYYDELFIPDKGNDKIWRLSEVGGNPGYFAIHGEILQPIGSGPRHIRIRVVHYPRVDEHPNPPRGPRFPKWNFSFPFECIHHPPDPPAGSAFAAAEILIPEPTADYPIPYIYTSNRNLGVQDTRGDTIAIFENVDNNLVLRNQVYTGLDQIRGMMSGEQAGYGGEAYIVAAGSTGTAGVKVFKRTEGGANLEEVAVNTLIPTSMTFVWSNQHQV
ncbi:Lactonase, 7-bladed beta-propeller-domain-containing protein [Melanogaster broomeanus]|nr:Lactonase, 7-bladed beta-propeller-domain-containing protein [Melanogaster broomeanus]